MKIKTVNPYNDYTGYQRIRKEDGRSIIHLVNNKTKKHENITLARYNMSIYLQRFLSKDEHVDHIDENRLNDDISNLQILSGADNNRKCFIENNRTELYVQLKCPNCGKVYWKPKRQSFLVKKAYYSTCSRECTYNIQRLKLSGNEMAELGKNQVMAFERKANIKDV